MLKVGRIHELGLGKNKEPERGGIIIHNWEEILVKILKNLLSILSGTQENMFLVENKQTRGLKEKGRENGGGWRLEPHTAVRPGFHCCTVQAGKSAGPPTPYTFLLSSPQ